jgi:cytochrome c oxidase subunit IV
MLDRTRTGSIRDAAGHACILRIGFSGCGALARGAARRRHRGLRTFLFASVGLFWLSILLWLGMMDFLTRT